MGWETVFLWLGVIVASSMMLSTGAERLAERFGGVFVGRTLLSVVTTLPEIVVVWLSASAGFIGVSLGSAIGSNIMMISIGLAIMVLVATTRLSKRPTLQISVEGYWMDMLYLVATALASVILFVDGYQLADGVAFTAFYLLYIYLAFKERVHERKPLKHTLTRSEPLKASILFILGGLGLLIGAEPFVEGIKEGARLAGLPEAALALVLSPLAGEMPEKLSVIMLARSGEEGARISIGNVLGSKILNNTLLLAVMILAASMAHGPGYVIAGTRLLYFQMYWAAILTVMAVMLMRDRVLSRGDAVILLGIYVVSVFLQLLVA